ncbi:AI-2E family transporter [Skermanella sp. TT6]|uniref:AI-2E family transporter n=1 Tax=Skermanella cutis TaxID=2775420 RepID=A0ABX7AZK8_9PROT|nr:AI-2E family transporter [Skermanella sp. TT6]QQP87520.1 AI-2E family transporter [Skermanella sp. TT6]
MEKVVIAEEPASRIPNWLRIVIWGLVIALGIGLIAVLGRTLVPFVVGAGLAFTFDPLAGWLGRKGVRRGWAALLVTLLTFGILAGILALLLPVLVEQARDLADGLPDLLNRVRAMLTGAAAQVPGAEVLNDTDLLRRIAQRTAEWVQQSAGDLLGFAATLFDIALLLVLTPVVTFYLLRDWNPVVRQIRRLVPRGSRKVVFDLVGEMTDRLAGFLRGMALSAVIQAVIHSVGLYLVGLNFAILIGVLTGLLVFVPVVGNLVMFIAAVTVALVQFDGWLEPLLVVLIYAASNVLETSVLEPVLVGNRTNLHPVWVIFALLVGGSLFGLVGALLALPAATVIAVLIRYAVDRYTHSRPYEEF